MKNLVLIALVFVLMGTSVFAQTASLAGVMADIEPVQTSTPKVDLGMNCQQDDDIMKSQLSTLWTAVTLNMITADVLSTYIPDSMNEFYDMAEGNEAEIMMAGAIMYQIPISMVYLSRNLSYKSNRMANMVAAGLMTAAVIGGGNTEPHYLVCGGAEVIMMSLIAWKAYKWPDPDKALSHDIGGEHNFGMNLNPSTKTYGFSYSLTF